MGIKGGDEKKRTEKERGEPPRRCRNLSHAPICRYRKGESTRTYKLSPRNKPHSKHQDAKRCLMNSVASTRHTAACSSQEKKNGWLLSAQRTQDLWIFGVSYRIRSSTCSRPASSCSPLLDIGSVGTCVWFFLSTAVTIL